MAADDFGGSFVYLALWPSLLESFVASRVGSDLGLDLWL